MQERLDFAGSLHPQSSTLGDFRADEKLIEAEMKALRLARKIITPHSEIASLFPEQAVLLDWKIPPATPRKSTNRKEKPMILFPAATVGSKGAYELREAISGLNIKLITLGANIEDKDFWKGFEVEKGDESRQENIDLVVFPAFVEHKPRRVLRAVAEGIPVIASPACGLENVKGVETVEFGNAKDLRLKIEKILWIN